MSRKFKYTTHLQGEWLESFCWLNHIQRAMQKQLLCDLNSNFLLLHMGKELLIYMIKAVNMSYVSRSNHSTLKFRRLEKSQKNPS